jgi:hypothetical protein
MRSFASVVALGSVFVLGATPRALAEPAPASIATKYLRDHAALVQSPLTALGAPQLQAVASGTGWVAEYRQTHAGLPVLGARVVVRIDELGQVRRLASSTVALPSIDTTPRVSAQAAVATARAGGALGDEAPGSTVLAIAPRAAGGPRLLWAVRLRPVPSLLENALYLVDARSGALLRRIDLLKYANARVFLQNPMVTPDAQPRPFPPGFAPTSPDGKLGSELLQGNNCVDRDLMTNVQGQTVHTCEMVPTATANAHGDYTDYAPAMEPFARPLNGCPGALYDGSHRQGLDEFAEQHSYWQAANTYAFFRKLFAEGGMPDWKLNQRPFPIGANLCTPSMQYGSLTGPLVPFDNAFFSPGAINPVSNVLLDGSDAILFGQGSSYDFAYDGDIVAHEFTHAVIDTLGKLTTSGYEDTQGLNDDPGSMNEAFADYFAAALGGDPAIGEYAGRNLGDAGAEGAIRRLDNPLRCADDRWGEVHQDSQPFSAAAWGARVDIAGDPRTPSSFDAAKALLFDRAVLSTIQGLPDPVDMPSAAAALVDETEQLLGLQARQAVIDRFREHAVLPGCQRVIPWTGKKRDLLMIDGTNSPYADLGSSRVPGFLQFKIDVPDGQNAIIVNLYVASAGGSAGPPSLELALGPAGQPIEWTPGASGGNQVSTARFSGNTGKVAAILTNVPRGKNYVMILNSGGSAYATKIELSTGCSMNSDCGGVRADDPGGKASTGTQSPRVVEGGCSQGGPARPGPGALGLSLLLLALALRRRARR